MYAHRLGLIATFIWSGAAVLGLGWTGRSDDPPGTLPLARQPVDSVDSERRKVVKGLWYEDQDDTITFEGRDYSPEEAIPVLVAVVTDRQSDVERRRLAWRSLSRLSSRLPTSGYMPVLLRACLEERDGLLKAGGLGCLIGTGDRALLGLAEHVLNTESDEVLRFVGAGALAEWNVRRGVEELVALLGSKTMLGKKRPFAGMVLSTLDQLNDRQGWGMPLKAMMEEVQRTHDIGTDCSLEQGMAALGALGQRIQDWFAANRERFPVIPAEEKDAWRALLDAPSKPVPAPPPPAPPDTQPTTSRAKRYNLELMLNAAKTTWARKEYATAEHLAKAVLSDPAARDDQKHRAQEILEQIAKDRAAEEGAAANRPAKPARKGPTSRPGKAPTTQPANPSGDEG